MWGSKGGLDNLSMTKWIPRWESARPSTCKIQPRRGKTLTSSNRGLCMKVNKVFCFKNAVLKMDETYSSSWSCCGWGHAYLWDDGKLGPQVVQAYLGYLHAVYGDLSCCGFKQPEEAQRHGGLPGPRATHDTNLCRKHTQRGMIGGIGLRMHRRWRFIAASPPSLLLWRSVKAVLGRGPVLPCNGRCSRETPRSPAWATQVGASCPPLPRGPVNINAASLLRKTFWTTH